MNITVVTGRLSRSPERRVLSSGVEHVGFEVTVAGPEGRAESVPVVWPGAPAAVSGLAAGDEVVVVGRVRRRFFRTGGATQSRTEVVAGLVVPARRAAAARRALSGAVDALAEGAAALPARRSGRGRGERAAQEAELS